ncbi:MAG: isochorismatase family cysteine hydrolase [bacterium]
MQIPLETDRAAVLVIELQNDMVHESRAGEKGLGGALAAQVEKRGVLGRVAGLLKTARGAGVPVFYINVANQPGVPHPRARIYQIAEKRGPTLVKGTWGAETHERVQPHEGDFVLERTISIDGSYGTGLYGILARLGRDQLVLTGISTTLAVEGVIRASLNRGFECWLAEDCCASFPQEWHDWSVANVLPLISTISDAENIQQELQKP